MVAFSRVSVRMSTRTKAPGRKRASVGNQLDGDLDRSGGLVHHGADPDHSSLDGLRPSGVETDGGRLSRTDQADVPLGDVHVRVERRKGAQTEERVRPADRLAQFHGPPGDAAGEGGAKLAAGDLQLDLLDFGFQLADPVGEFPDFGRGGALVVLQLGDLVAQRGHLLFAHQVIGVGPLLPVQLQGGVLDLDLGLLSPDPGLLQLDSGLGQLLLGEPEADHQLPVVQDAQDLSFSNIDPPLRPGRCERSLPPGP